MLQTEYMRLLLLFFFSMRRLPPLSTLFPYTTLFRSVVFCDAHVEFGKVTSWLEKTERGRLRWNNEFNIDRKSTRLNSSHVEISYAVFCLKKKIKNIGTFYFND